MPTKILEINYPVTLGCLFVLYTEAAKRRLKMRSILRGGPSVDELNDVYEKYFNTIWHICLAYMRHTQEAEDSVQETFLRYARYIQKKPEAFNSDDDVVKEKKTKSWLIVTAGNVCKDQLKNWWRKHESLEWYEDKLETPAYEIDTMLEAVMELPEKYKIPIYLYYYMSYDSAEIAHILHKPKSTIRNYLSEARKLLRQGMDQGFKERGVQNEGAY